MKRVSGIPTSSICAAVALVAACWGHAQAQGAAAFPSSAAATSSTQQAPAQDSGFLNFFRKTELAGTADIYFHYNFNKPPTGSLTPLRNFDFEHNQFSLALAELALSKPATEDDLSYLAPVGEGLQIDVGKFVTQHGAEVIETKDNWNYSRSLLFSWAIPYYHMGVRVGYAATDKVTLGASLSNGWNNSTDNNSQKTWGFAATIKPTPALSIVQNYMIGPEQTDNTDDWRHLSDTTITYTVNDKVSVMGNYDYGRDGILGQAVTWQGVGLYVKAQVNPYFAVIPRWEYYNDEDGFTTGAAQNLQEFTLTAEVKHSQGLITRFEYRRDWSDIDFFTKDGRPGANQNTFSVGFVYAFSTK